MKRLTATVAQRAFRSSLPIIAAFALLGAGSVHPVLATDKCGAVCNETWTTADSPYVVTCDVTVAAECELTIEADVSVRFQAATGLLVNGSLDVNGASGAEVTFTSDTAFPAAGAWLGLHLANGATATLDYAAISYAADGLYAYGSGTSATLNQVTTTHNNRGVYVYNQATATLTGVTARLNDDGLYVHYGNATQVEATNCTFTDNNRYGVVADGYSGSHHPMVNITGSSIHSNLGGYDLYAVYYRDPTQHPIQAQGNWWGTTLAPAIASRIYDHRNHANSPIVDWCGWLDGPGGVAARDANCPDLAVCDEVADWIDNGKPYLLTSDLVVCATGRLNIGPDVEVRTLVGTPKPDFVVYGILDVNGTPGHEVSFTSDTASPAPGNWLGLHLADGATGTLDYATISYATDGVYAYGNGTSATLNQVTATHNTRGVYVYNEATATLTDVTARFNDDGLYVYYANATRVDATNCTFTDNNRYGLFADGYSGSHHPSVNVTGSSIHSNLGAHDLYAVYYRDPTQHPIQAQGNWWGTTLAPAIASRIYDHRNHANSPIVDWCGWLDGPGGVSARDVNCPDLAICDEVADWNDNGKPYLLTSDLVVCASGRLNVGPAVEVRTLVGNPKPDFLVNGILDVNGSPGSEVTFTSDAASPATGNWLGLHLANGATATLDHATISYATDGLYAYGTGTSATLNQVTVTHNTRGVYVYNEASANLTDVIARFNNDGLYVHYGNATQVDATNCTFSDNNRYGVHADGYSGSHHPSVNLTGSSIHSNLGAYDLYAVYYRDPTQHPIQAQGNWWGTTHAPAIATRIYDQRNHANSPIVDWCGWLDGPGGTPERDVNCPDLAICDEVADWNDNGKPYLLTSDVVVCATGRLNVGPDVEVRTLVGTPKPDFLVYGILDVNGTAGHEVSFTSDSASPAPGNWLGLHLANGATGTLDHAAISYATDGVYAYGNGTSATLNQVTATHNTRGVYIYNQATATLTDVTARFNNDGLYVYYANATRVDATNCTFTDNNRYGLFADGYSGSHHPTVNLTGSSIHSNLGAYDLYAVYYRDPTHHSIQAQGNWWGTTLAPAIASRIYDHRNHANSPIVDWCGWLDGPGGVGARDVNCPDLAICDEVADWLDNGKPYLLTSDLVVCATGRLNVGPAVEVRTVVGNPKPDFLVHGILDVNGSPGSEVTFTSDTASPAPGNWLGLHLANGATGSLDHATISFATDGLYAYGTGTSATLNQVTATRNTRGVYVYNEATANLTDVIARFNNDGLYVYYGNATRVDATDCTFTDNHRYGVFADGYSGSHHPSVDIAGSSIHSNGGSHDVYAVYYRDPTQHPIQAQGNWWGTTQEPAIASRIYDHRNHANSPIVDWCGWLDGPSGTPERDVNCPDLGICDEVADWNDNGKPYLLTSDLVVCATGRLNVGPDVEVRTVVAEPKPDFVVYGILDVNGTSDGEVSFTSDATSPVTGDWLGLHLADGATGSLDHATISYATDGVFAYGSGTSATLNQVTATHNTRGVHVYNQARTTLIGVTARFNDDGLHVYYGNTTQAEATGCTFTDNSRYGVFADGYSGSHRPVLRVSGSSIHSNRGGYELYATFYRDAASTVIWAPDNWWGTSSLAQIRQLIFDHEDSASSPHVRFDPHGPDCDTALGPDSDLDGVGDFEDNCPRKSNRTQTDTDGDRMGDRCDPEPTVQPVGACDGFDDESDGFVDTDGDAWGDPCDFQPTRDDCYPGAPEICDGRDNNGDGTFAAGELVDDDWDYAIACGDCEDLQPAINSCVCEDCFNTIDDDCSGLTDGEDGACAESPYCVVVSVGTHNPRLIVDKGPCGGATLFDPCDILRGSVEELQLTAGSVDLGQVACLANDMPWDRVTTLLRDADPECNDGGGIYYVAKMGPDSDYGTASTGEPRDTMTPVCP